MAKNKYNIGDKIRAKVNYMNDNRKEVDATIIGIELDTNTNDIKYKIKFEPKFFIKKQRRIKIQPCTGCVGYITEVDVIKLYSDNVSCSLTHNDFNMVESNPNGEFVRISEINDMIRYGVISLDKTKLKEYKFDTTVTYDKDKYTREEALKLWYGRLS